MFLRKKNPQELSRKNRLFPPEQNPKSKNLLSLIFDFLLEKPKPNQEMSSKKKFKLKRKKNEKKNGKTKKENLKLKVKLSLYSQIVCSFCCSFS